MKTVKRDIWARVDERDVKRIDRLAASLRLSRSATAGMLLAAALKTWCTPEDVIARAGDQE